MVKYSDGTKIESHSGTGEKCEAGVIPVLSINILGARRKLNVLTNPLRWGDGLERERRILGTALQN